MDEMKLIFLEESKENIEKLNENILYLEENPDDIETINELFRCSHTLKGMYATMGFREFADLTHKMEDLMDAFRNNIIKVTSEKIDILLKSTEILEEMTDEYERNGEMSRDISDILSLFDDFDMNKSKNKNTDSNKNISLNNKSIEIRVNKIDMLGARILMLYRKIYKELNIKDTNPKKDDILNTPDDEIGEKIILVLDKEQDANSAIDIISKIAKTVDSELINDLKIIEPQSTIKKEAEKKTVKNVKDAKAESKTNDNKATSIVRIESERVDNIMNLIAELVTEKNRLEVKGKELQDEILMETIDRIDRTINNLQDVVMKIRMIEMENTFKIFPREIRNISKKLNKKVKLTIEGGDTELDRSVVDQIKNPLVHIIKNSLDHGIESPEERVEKGKKEEGELLLSAKYEGNQVVITVSDDGRGIDPELIAKKAVEKNLITQQQVNTMTSQEKVNLICIPGFSTVEKVTELSGRGVGLDAVRSFIENLSGRLEVESYYGKGTTVRLYVPLTLAIIQSMLVEVSGEKYAIPLHSIETIVSTSSIEHKNINGNEVIVYKKNALNVMHLSDIVKLDKTSENEYVIIVKKMGKLHGLLVNNVLGQQEIVIKNLGKHLKSIKEYSGATILGDGSVALILDINNII